MKNGLIKDGMERATNFFRNVTMVDCLIVLAILGILAGLVAPHFLSTPTAAPVPVFRCKDGFLFRLQGGTVQPATEQEAATKPKC